MFRLKLLGLIKDLRHPAILKNEKGNAANYRLENLYN